MKVLIIEDENLAASRLEKLIITLQPDVEVLDKIETVRRSVEWLTHHERPDLIFLDIQLADGLSFEIFKQVKVNTPVIFTTSYDQYALKAFQLNSVDYLLKPIKEEELKNAMNKYADRTSNFGEMKFIDEETIRQLFQSINKSKYKERFVVKIGEHIKTLTTGDILFVESKEKTTFVKTKDLKTFIIDYTLDQLSDLLDPSEFFRINRKYIISLHSFDDIIAWSNSRLRVCLKGDNTMNAIVAREKVADFKKWLEGELI